MLLILLKIRPNVSSQNPHITNPAPPRLVPRRPPRPEQAEDQRQHGQRVEPAGFHPELAAQQLGPALPEAAGPGGLGSRRGAGGVTSPGTARTATRARAATRSGAPGTAAHAGPAGDRSADRDAEPL